MTPIHPGCLAAGYFKAVSFIELFSHLNLYAIVTASATPLLLNVSVLSCRFNATCFRYQLDESSPEDGVYEEECHYWILSKAIKQKTPTATGGSASAADGKTSMNGTTNGHANCAEKHK